MKGLTLDILISGWSWSNWEQFGSFADLAPHAFRVRTTFGNPDTALATLLSGKGPADHGCFPAFGSHGNHGPRAASIEWDKMLPPGLPPRGQLWCALGESSDEDEVRALGDVLRRGHADRALLRLRGLEKALARGDDLEASLARLRRQVGTLFMAGLENRGQVDLRVFGDKGWGPRRHGYDLRRTFRRHGLREGREYSTWVEPAWARFRFHMMGADVVVRQIIEDLAIGRYVEGEALHALEPGRPPGDIGDAALWLSEGGMFVPNDLRWEPAHVPGPDPGLSCADTIALFSSHPSVPVKDLMELHQVLFGAPAGSSSLSARAS